MTNNSVLIVDDTPVNLKLVRILLSRQGFEVRTANRAEEALEIVQSFHPRLILADIQLPGMDGLEMARRIKTDPVTRDTIILALTAFAMKGDEQKAFDAGCDGYITKPIDTRSLPLLIRKYLSRGKEAPNSGLQIGRRDSAVRERQQAFLAEGVEQSGRLISMLGSGFDHAGALAIAHRWTETAGSVGYLQIGRYAQELETLLRQNGPASLVPTREMLVRLARSFAESLEELSRQ
jgi:two-component system cell cycle response regulator DivK